MSTVHNFTRDTGRAGEAAFRFLGTGPARGKHREQMWLYAAIPRARNALSQNILPKALRFEASRVISSAPRKGDAAEIARFCSRTYNVTFPMFGKIDVNGAAAHPLYRFLKGKAKGVMAIKWNFTKFLVDRKGGVAARFAPAAAPKGL